MLSGWQHAKTPLGSCDAWPKNPQINKLTVDSSDLIRNQGKWPCSHGFCWLGGQAFFRQRSMSPSCCTQNVPERQLHQTPCRCNTTQLLWIFPLIPAIVGIVDSWHLMVELVDKEVCTEATEKSEALMGYDVSIMFLYKYPVYELHHKRCWSAPGYNRIA